MDSFPLTKKKLLQQPPARRQRLISDWLRQVYLKLREQKFSAESLEHIEKNYREVLDWIDETPIGSLKNLSQDQWVETISDRFHFHKRKSGIGLSEHNLLPSVKTGDRLTSSPWNAPLTYSVALDNLRSAFNVGSIFRLADAAGFQTVITGGSTPGKENQQVVKTSMGSTDWIPQESTDNLSQRLKLSQKSGFQIIGIETVDSSDSHLIYPWPSRGIVVLGNEEYGLSQTVMSVCDNFVHIPMYGRKNSINVATAFAVIAFHIANTIASKTNT